ncbi:MAG: hypothetical protein ACT4PW_06035 [Acidimicrobiia bacterium]
MSRNGRTSSWRSERLNPFDPDQLDKVLRELRGRAQAGESVDALRAEFFERLWPWATRSADRETRLLPPHADVDELRSRLLHAVWRTCQGLDPSNSETWAALLRIRWRGARADAARSDDRLSRTDRRRVGTDPAAPVLGEEGCNASDSTGGPVPRTASEPGAALDRRLLAEIGRYPQPVDALEQHVDDRWDPERAAMDGAMSDELQRWLRDDLPEDVAKDVHAWWQRTGGHGELPVGLERRAQAYAFRLAALVETAS